MTSAGELTRDFAVMGLHDDREDIPEGELTKTKSCGDLTLAFPGAELHGELEDTKELTKAKSCGDLTLAFPGMELHGELENVKEVQLQTTIIALKVSDGIMMAFDRRKTTPNNRTGVNDRGLSSKKDKWEAIHPSLHVLNSGHSAIVQACREKIRKYVIKKVQKDQVSPTVLETRKYLVKVLKSNALDAYKRQVVTVVIAGIIDSVPSIGVVWKDWVSSGGVSKIRVRYRMKKRFACHGSGRQHAQAVLNEFLYEQFVVQRLKIVEDDKFVNCVKRAMVAACKGDKGTGERIHLIHLRSDGTYEQIYKAFVVDAELEVLGEPPAMDSEED